MMNIPINNNKYKIYFFFRNNIKNTIPEPINISSADREQVKNVAIRVKKINEILIILLFLLLFAENRKPATKIKNNT